MKNVMNGVAWLNSKDFDKLLTQHSWVVLAAPIAIYLIDKLYDLSNDVMNKGYTLSLTVNADDGFDFGLKPQATPE